VESIVIKEKVLIVTTLTARSFCKDVHLVSNPGYGIYYLWFNLLTVSDSFIAKWQDFLKASHLED